MAIPIRTASPPQRKNFRIQKFKGINKSVTPSQIDDSQSPDMLNFMLDSEYALDKRPGYFSLFEGLLGADTWEDGQWDTALWEDGIGNNPIKNLFAYRKLDGNIERLLFHGGTIYKWTDSDYTEVHSGIEDTNIVSWQVNDKFYFMDGVNFFVYDGTNVNDATAPDKAYVPNVILGKLANGTSGTASEQFNLVGKGFEQTFSPDGSATTFDLNQYVGSTKTFDATNLDATEVVVTYNSVVKTENIHFTVNRTTGIVNTNAGTSPIGIPSAGTNTLKIKAFKTPTDYETRKSKILKSTIVTFYGGSNDNRIFLSGNPDLKDFIYRSGTDVQGKPNPTYWPENTYSLVGANNELIMNWAKQYDTLVILKESTAYTISFDASSGTALYSTKPINDYIGIYAKNTLQVLDNSPTFVSKKGVFQLVSGQVRDERNMKHISAAIDSDLLNESELDKAISYDFDRKYYIVLPSGKVYIYDYKAKEWLIWDNIKSNCFIDFNNYLYFGSNQDGKIYKIKKLDEIGAFYDDGQAINSYWKSKVFNLTRGDFQKLIDRLIITLKPYSASSAKVYYSADKKVSKYVKTIDLLSFDFNTLDFSNFTFESFSLPQTKTANINENSTVYFQIELTNNESGEGLGITEIGILHSPQKYVQ